MLNNWNNLDSAQRLEVITEAYDLLCSIDMNNGKSLSEFVALITTRIPQCEVKKAIDAFFIAGYFNMRQPGGNCDNATEGYILNGIVKYFKRVAVAMVRYNIGDRVHWDYIGPNQQAKILNLVIDALLRTKITKKSRAEILTQLLDCESFRASGNSMVDFLIESATNEEPPPMTRHYAGDYHHDKNTFNKLCDVVEVIEKHF
jgi:hypothetical protein